MRAIADRLHAAGYYTLSLRMQGHGTVPGGLVNVTWEDWAAAVRMGARHARQTIGDGLPLVLVGYSNGGALVINYVLETLGDDRLPAATKVVLVSPMVGVSPMARLARMISLLGPVPFFEKARWVDIVPEYNPVKYNSFPANAAVQTSRFTRAIQDQPRARGRPTGASPGFRRCWRFSPWWTRRSARPLLSPICTIACRQGGHELVLFDINRQSGVQAFTRPGAVLPRLTNAGTRRYTATLVTNTATDTPRRVGDDGVRRIDEPQFGAAWPGVAREMFSLSHIALPFPHDDPVYGGESVYGEAGGVALGRVVPRGEKDVLLVPLDALMRVSWNPFFSYLAARIERWID